MAAILREGNSRSRMRERTVFGGDRFAVVLELAPRASLRQANNEGIRLGKYKPE
jgi:hypothetical protein